MLGEFGLDQCEGQPGADEDDVRLLTEQVGNGADVVLVRMGQDDRVDLVQPRPHIVEVGQDQVYARLIRLGEEDAAVDDEQPPGVFEHRHVAADLAKTAEGDDTQPAWRELGRRAQVGMRVTHRRPLIGPATSAMSRAAAVRITSGVRRRPALPAAR